MTLFREGNFLVGRGLEVRRLVCDPSWRRASLPRKSSSVLAIRVSHVTQIKLQVGTVFNWMQLEIQSSTEDQSRKN
ncbi:hypothetical protein NDU88_001973 [Pleurodeles waltl]|uniref:Uncharacterized protein n=1 Tax=Pleurodeles waltl TaxID=8319 RepID=A0AAV7WJY3_PLEWA|nr:hypothetical protein NDU88_001973 [Pleurodeles waltl]